VFRKNNRSMLLRLLFIGAFVCALTFVSVVSARAIFQSYVKTNPDEASHAPPQNPANDVLTRVSSNQEKVRSESLKKRALERDVEVESTAEANIPPATLPVLIRESSAIIVGKITNARSFFDESGDPILEYGDIITTEYGIEVLRVFKNTTLDRMPPADKLPPAALTTPLKIARNGGEVSVNGHKASVKVKGYEGLIPGCEYVFFLNWSPDYKAYVLTYGIYGAVAVDENKSLRPLANSEEIKSNFRKLNLESLAAEINR
jgi:hypothetical protein